MTENWTDGRLDELSAGMTGGFTRVDERFLRVDERFDRIEERFESLQKEMIVRFEGGQREANTRHDALMRELTMRSDAVQRTIVHGVIGITSAFIAGFAAILVLIATQL